MEGGLPFQLLLAAMYWHQQAQAQLQAYRWSHLSRLMGRLSGASRPPSDSSVNLQQQGDQETGQQTDGPYLQTALEHCCHSTSNPCHLIPVSQQLLLAAPPVTPQHTHTHT